MDEISAQESGPRVQAAAAAIETMMAKRSSDLTDHTLTETLAPANPATHANPRISELLQYLGQSESERGTFLYLGYGSNLSKETFRGKRGIKPLSQVNVQVPTLRLTFDLPGIPYVEPCFANTGRRDPEHDRPSQVKPIDVNGNEKSPLLPQHKDKDHYRKDRWHKGLIGVVYEVTPEDYAHIIETEGGGASYHDIVVDCHPLPLDDPEAAVPQNPTLPPFRAHTLFAPATPPDEPPPKDGGRFQRPDVSYAQASARYLKLMSDGAAELGLPYEYQDYLHAIRPYTITTAKQRVGSFVLLALWGPIVGAVFGLSKLFADKKGRVPGWLRVLLGAVFKSVWVSYDKFFKPIFGDGERTISDRGEDDDGGESERMRSQSRVRESKTMDHMLQEKDAIVRQIV